jgi:hypothetical protein
MLRCSVENSFRLEALNRAGTLHLAAVHPPICAANASLTGKGGHFG